MTDEISYRRLIYALIFRCSGMKYFHAIPCMVNPQMNPFNESDNFVDLCLVLQVLSRLSAFSSRFSKNNFESCKSSKSQSDRWIM